MSQIKIYAQNNTITKHRENLSLAIYEALVSELKYPFTVLSSLLLAGFISACSTTSYQTPTVNSKNDAVAQLNHTVQGKMTVEQAEQCKTLGGTVTVMGLTQFDFCAITYSDDETVCNDGNQCQAGVCLAPSNGVPVGQPHQKGKCAGSNIGFGCHQVIKKGIANEPMVCVD